MVELALKVAFYSMLVACMLRIAIELLCGKDLDDYNVSAQTPVTVTVVLFFVLLLLAAGVSIGSVVFAIFTMLFY